MGKWLLPVIALFIGISLTATEADAAKRLGGARSSGVQRNVTAPPASTPARPAQQQAAPQGAQQAAPGAAAGAAGAAAKPASGLAKWFPMLGGLALGGMLGWLLASNGGSFLLLALLAVAAVVVFSLLARRRQGSPQTVQYAGGGQERVTVPDTAPMASRATAIASSASLPAGFDADGFLRGAKMNFVRLQVANDRGSVDEIREFTTPEMFQALSQDIQARAGTAQHTEVSGLNAELLELTTEGGQHWASVRFSGTERDGGQAEEFAEVWNLAKPVDGSTGWLLAGIQQLH